MISKDKLLLLGKQIEDYCRENQIFGMLRISHRDTVVFEKSYGYADLQEKRPFSKSSLFSLYSISKAFCAIGLLKLYDKGLVDLDAHPSRYIPEAKGLDGRVTVRHLLHHTSGIPDFEQDKEFRDSHLPGTPERIRAHVLSLSEREQLFAPGTDLRYANVNFVLCALIIENVAGLSYDVYLKKEVLAPLGMKSATLDHKGLILPDRVTGYEFINGKPKSIDRSLHWMLGAGDVIGSIDDVYALNLAAKHAPLLKPATWELALTPSPVSGYGMGCRVFYWHEKKCIMHTGGHLGFRTMHRQIPRDDLDIILLSNSGYGNARLDISEMIHKAFYEGDDEESAFIEMDKGYI